MIGPNRADGFPQEAQETSEGMAVEETGDLPEEFSEKFRGFHKNPRGNQAEKAGDGFGKRHDYPTGGMVVGGKAGDRADEDKPAELTVHLPIKEGGKRRDHGKDESGVPEKKEEKRQNAALHPAMLARIRRDSAKNMSYSYYIV